MKILYIIESFGPGGKERRLSQLIEALSKRSDFDIEVIVTAEIFHYKNVLEKDIKIHRIDKGLLPGKKSGMIQFYKICKRFKPDIIHTWGGLITILAIPSSILCRVPIIDGQVTAATKKPLWETMFFYKIPFLFSKYIVSNTKAAIKVYGIPKKKSICIYNGFDFNRVSNLSNKENIKKQLDIKTKFVVGMVASILPVKDHKTVMKSAFRLLNKRKDITFIFAGSGDSTELEKIIPDNLNSFFRFLPPSKNIEDIMNVCNIGVLCSFNEGLPNVVIEFMALGKPVIASNVGGVPEVIKDKFNGFIIDIGDYISLAKIINQLLDNENILNDIGRKAQKHINSYFDISIMKDKFITLYGKTING